MGSADEFDLDGFDLLLEDFVIDEHDETTLQLIDQQSQALSQQQNPQYNSYNQPPIKQPDLELSNLKSQLIQTRGETDIVRSKLNATLAENVRLSQSLIQQKRSNLSNEQTQIDGYIFSNF
jgi:hypothetical protein